MKFIVCLMDYLLMPQQEQKENRALISEVDFPFSIKIYQRILHIRSCGYAIPQTWHTFACIKQKASGFWHRWNNTEWNQRKTHYHERNSTEIMEPKYLKPFVKNKETTGRYSSVCDRGSWIRSELIEMTSEMTECDLQYKRTNPLEAKISEAKISLKWTETLILHEIKNLIQDLAVISIYERFQLHVRGMLFR